MLILPLDHSEPYFATLGVMLYPAVDDADPPKARAYVAQVLARAFSRLRDAGGSPPYDVLAQRSRCQTSKRKSLEKS